MMRTLGTVILSPYTIHNTLCTTYKKNGILGNFNDQGSICSVARQARNAGNADDTHIRGCRVVWGG